MEDFYLSKLHRNVVIVGIFIFFNTYFLILLPLAIVETDIPLWQLYALNIFACTMGALFMRKILVPTWRTVIRNDIEKMPIHMQVFMYFTLLIIAVLSGVVVNYGENNLFYAFYVPASGLMGAFIYDMWASTYLKVWREYSKKERFEIVQKS
ncbi:hypothetical protein GLW08_12730 [Pontibacillus yanchengensis]|uniref:Uncharacterized protein n=1 Tax=Pontibacillus yanchengensis TaxID=462910 RepID=A0ACC7VHL5_9BACI|nr:hypothetical protein [Pontibacillus yanchengensis]MYL54202.1 hypothetical protein [Pontibacillus yanchengensis]